MEKRKTVIFTEKLKTSMIEKHFAIINCSDTAYLAEAQQDQSLIVLEAIQTWRKKTIGALETLHAN